jgi:CDP-glucose 4,6-dehydratase
MDERAPRWHGRRVLVTGCSGFLGGWVVRELLAAGAEVVGLVRDRAAWAAFARHRFTGRVHVVHGRVEDTFRVHSALAVHEAAAVFHLVAPIDRGTAAVLESVRRYDPRIPVVIARPFDAVPPSPDAAVPLGVARFGEVFGGGDRNASRLVPATLIGLLTGDRATRAMDAGGPRDFVYARDAARACLTLAEVIAERPQPHEVAFRSGWVLTAREMATAVRDVLDGRAPVAPGGPSPANPLGWHPAAPFADALAETVAWYREFVRTRPSPTGATDPARRAA